MMPESSSGLDEPFIEGERCSARLSCHPLTHLDGVQRSVQDRPGLPQQQAHPGPVPLSCYTTQKRCWETIPRCRSRSSSTDGESITILQKFLQHDSDVLMVSVAHWARLCRAAGSEMAHHQDLWLHSVSHTHTRFPSPRAPFVSTSHSLYETLSQRAVFM